MSSITINVGGDLFFGGRFATESSDRQEAVVSLREKFQTDSLNIVNLESPLTTSTNPLPKTGPNMKAHPRQAAVLEAMGVQAVTLANNHIADYGTKGIEDTLQVLNDYQIAFTGIEGGNVKAKNIIDWQGVKIALLNFSENEWSTIPKLDHHAVAIDPVNNFYAIQQAKKTADVVLVITHSGHEHFSYPTLRMKEWLRFFIEAGADAVINHHPHCISGVETYQRKPIFYSVGNFWFDAEKQQNQKWNQGMIAQLTIDHELNVSANAVHFNQGNDKLFEWSCGSDLTEREDALYELSRVITNNEALQEKFEAWKGIQAKRYKSYIEPVNVRLIKALQVRGLLPSFWSRKQKRLLLNLFRCESHRELFLKVLEDDVSNS